jgi:heme oxygenase
VQHAFHSDIDALYDNPDLDDLLPDLKGRRRLNLIRQDLADLGVAGLVEHVEPVFTKDAALDLPTALGWLYVAEGSNLGAAFLLKEAVKLGFSETSGARHLAGAPEGRGLHWRTFMAALDTVALSHADEGRVVAGAEAAFRRTKTLVDTIFGEAVPA